MSNGSAASVAGAIPGNQVVARYNGSRGGYDPYLEPSSPSSDSFVTQPGYGYFILTDTNGNYTFATPPAADFTSNVTSGVAWVEATGNPDPLVVQFNDTSMGATAWEWNFSDGSSNSTEQNPVHSFANAWSYNVTLTVTTPDGPKSVEKDSYINVLLPVVGNVNKSLSLSMADLDSYPQITIENHTYRRSGGRVFQTYATGASLNAILNDAQVRSGAVMVTFYASDLYQSYVMLSNIRADNGSMITHNWYNNDPSELGYNNTTRLIMPADTFAQNWGHHLIGMKVQ